MATSNPVSAAPDLDRAHIAAVKGFIARTWDATLRTPAQQGPDEVPLPHPFVVPTAGPAFHIFFYWDTYFACQGLLRSGRLEQARQSADNLLHLIETLGYVPNFTLQAHLNRSQPPVASALARAIYARTRDQSWLARAHAALAREYAFWMAFRCGPHGLNHYGHHATPGMVDDFARDIHSRLPSMPDEPCQRLAFAAHALAEAESGWDFTPRFDRRCADFYAVDLNCLLYMHEVNAADFCAELGDDQADVWRERAQRRRDLVNRLCWDEASGFYYDYDMTSGRRAGMETAAAFFALWCGIAAPEQAARLAANLPRLERDHGLLTCAPGPRPAGQVYQWDAPNAWPPLQFAAVAGLWRYGFRAEAGRLAARYTTCVARNFAATGNLWEKYNAVTGGVDVSGEYDMPAMLGWTAGTFLYACEILGV